MTDLTAFMNAKPKLYTHDQLKTPAPIINPPAQPKAEPESTYLTALYAVGEAWI